MPPKSRQAAAKTKIRRKEKKNVAAGSARRSGSPISQTSSHRSY
jgi:hypothetical protein